MCKEGMGGGCPHKKLKAVGILALRLALGLIFVYAGLPKLGSAHAETAVMFGALGLPGSASLWVYLVGGLEVLGGVMIALGIFVRYAAIWLSVIMLVAMYVLRSQPFFMEFTPVLALGGCLSLLGTGAGKYRLVMCECCCKVCKAKYAEMKAGSCCGGSCGNSCGEKK